MLCLLVKKEHFETCCWICLDFSRAIIWTCDSAILEGEIISVSQSKAHYTDFYHTMEKLSFHSIHHRYTDLIFENCEYMSSFTYSHPRNHSLSLAVTKLGFLFISDYHAHTYFFWVQWLNECVQKSLNAKASLHSSYISDMKEVKRKHRSNYENKESFGIRE